MREEKVIKTDPASNFGLGVVGFPNYDDSRRQAFLLVCGRTVGKEQYCNRAVQEHPFLPVDGMFVVVCDRTDTTPEASDFWLSYNHFVLPYENYEGNEAKVESLINRTSSEDAHGNILDEAHYVSVEYELNALESWRDKTFKDNSSTKLVQYYSQGKPSEQHVEPTGTQSWACTLTKEQHLFEVNKAKEAKANGSLHIPATEALMTMNWDKREINFTPMNDGNYITPEERNAYVEGNDGFLAREFLDLELTRRHHAHLLNVFRDNRTGDIRIGSIRVAETVDKHIQATCVLDSCAYSSMTINPHEVTREQMEDFVYAIVAHGNNHAAKFIRTKQTKPETRTENSVEFVAIPGTRRLIPWSDSEGDYLRVSPEYRKVVVDKPVVTNSKVTPIWYEISEVVPPVVEDPELNDVEFLFEHQKYCNNLDCKCSEILAEMVPALA